MLLSLQKNKQLRGLMERQQKRLITTEYQKNDKKEQGRKERQVREKKQDPKRYVCISGKKNIYRGCFVNSSFRDMEDVSKEDKTIIHPRPQLVDDDT